MFKQLIIILPLSKDKVIISIVLPMTQVKITASEEILKTKANICTMHGPYQIWLYTDFVFSEIPSCKQF